MLLASLLNAFQSAHRSGPPKIVQLAVMGLLIVLGIQSIVAAFTRKSFRWRTGAPMPTELGRVSSLFIGLFLIGTVILFLFWKK
jgi:hypothetical protein